MTTDKNGKLKLTLTEDNQGLYTRGQIIAAFAKGVTKVFGISPDDKAMSLNDLLHGLDQSGWTLYTKVVDPKPEPTGWRTDIGNAPRDGSAILALIVYTTDRQVRPETIEYNSGGWWRGYTELEDYEITHWMEIPKVPGV